MIDEVDDALRTLIKRDALNGADVDIVFDAPTKDWAARRNAPTIDVYLYDIREDLGRRQYGTVDVRGANGMIEARHSPPRYFKFSYLITAWTQRPEDEHRLLSAVLRCFLRYEVIPFEVVSGGLAEQGYPVGIKIGLPPPQDRSVSDVWSALGGELKPSLDLVTLVAIDARGLTDVAPLVFEEPRIGIRGTGGQKEEAGGNGKADGRPPKDEAPEAPAAEPPRAEEEVGIGTTGKAGRIVRIRTTKP